MFAVRKFLLMVLVSSFVLCIPAFAEGEEETVVDVPESVETGGTGDTVYYVPDYPDYWVAHVEAPDGGADLNTICACIMCSVRVPCAASSLGRSW